MRVAYIVTGYPYVSHTFVQREVLALRRLGAEVETFAVRRSSPEDLRSDDDRREFATTHTLRPLRFGRYAGAHARAILSPRARWLRALRTSMGLASPEPRSIAWRFFYFVQAVVLWDRVRRRGMTHVHAHFANVSADLAMLATEVGGPGWTWSFTMHGPTEFADVEAHRLRQKAASATFVACISDYCRSQLMALLPVEQWDKLHIVRCGVDPDRFSPARERTDDGPLRLICIARMVPVKGHAVLIEAVRVLRGRGIALELTLIGDGPDRSALERQVEEAGLGSTVTFRGSLGQDEVRVALASADVLCLPSFAEGVPVVLMEAMSMAIPVVCSRITGIPELVVHDESGKVVSPGRSDLVAEAIAALAGAPEHRREMGLAGRRRIEDLYTSDGNASVLLAQFSRYGQ